MKLFGFVGGVRTVYLRMVNAGVLIEKISQKSQERLHEIEVMIRDDRPIMHVFTKSDPTFPSLIVKVLADSVEVIEKNDKQCEYKLDKGLDLISDEICKLI